LVRYGGVPPAELSDFPADPSSLFRCFVSSRTSSSNRQGGVFRPEADAVAKRVVDGFGDAAVRNVIEITLRVGLLVVDRRRKKTVFHPKDRADDSRGTRGALRMADHRFERAHGNFIRGSPKTKLDRQAFGFVIQYR